MKRQTLQASLFQGLANVETEVISRREDFETLFDGFTEMRAISYVVSSDLLRCTGSVDVGHFPPYHFTKVLLQILFGCEITK